MCISGKIYELENKDIVYDSNFQRLAHDIYQELYDWYNIGVICDESMEIFILRIRDKIMRHIIYNITSK